MKMEVWRVGPSREFKKGLCRGSLPPLVYCLCRMDLRRTEGYARMKQWSGASWCCKTRFNELVAASKATTGPAVPFGRTKMKRGADGTAREYGDDSSLQASLLGKNGASTGYCVVSPFFFKSVSPSLLSAQHPTIGDGNKTGTLLCNLKGAGHGKVKTRARKVAVMRMEGLLKWHRLRPDRKSVV